MKILIPILGFGRHGGKRVLTQLANNWIEQGHEAVFLVPEWSDEPYFSTKAKIIRANQKGIVTDEMHVKAEDRNISGAENLISLYAGLNSIGSRFDVILANHSLTAWPVRFAKCGAAKKFYYIQAYEPEYYPFLKSPLKHLLSKFSYHLNLDMMSNSQTYPPKSGHSIMEVISPGIDRDIFWPRTSWNNMSDTNVITLGTIGRLEPYKGTKYVLEAFEKLYETNPKYRLRVAFGNLPQGWSHANAEIVQIESDRELAEFYRSLDILLVGACAQFGAPHYPVIEAMSVLTPVVHTGFFPGTAKNSWLAVPKDAASIARKVVELTNDKEKERKIKSAESFVAENLTWQAVSSAMLTYFHKSILDRNQ
jgi:glycosyltransferase involved in cell wall biosynthesis